jgi:NAD(P)H-hydrate epimerase
LLLDADALSIASADPAMLRVARAPLVLTPHPGEMARLVGIETAAVQADRVGVARRFAAAQGCVLVLKGARTVIAAPDGFVWINPTGNPGMASGGMGDALAGAIGALLAQGLPAADAACLGAYVHGAAADAAAESGEIGLLAGDVADGLRGALHRLRAESPLDA